MSEVQQQSSLHREELERMLFFEEARQRAEADHAQNPTDAHVLTRWGGALLELAHFRQGIEAVEMIELAVTKFNAALEIDPKKHDALWCLGNALTSQGFLFAEAEKAQEYFEEAKSCFERAVAEEPENEIYKKALEMTEKAPSLHAELQNQLAAQQRAQEAAQQYERGHQNASGGGGSTRDGGEQEDPDAFYYSMLGWGTFAVVATSWLVMMNVQAARAQT
jgi:tetratricopeptide (TPR) repeat protein